MARTVTLFDAVTVAGYSTPLDVRLYQTLGIDISGSSSTLSISFLHSLDGVTYRAKMGYNQATDVGATGATANNTSWSFDVGKTAYIKLQLVSMDGNVTVTAVAKRGWSSLDMDKVEDELNLTYLGIDGSITPDQITDGHDHAYVTTGTGAPTSTPTRVGLEYYDLTGKKLYKSFGSSSSADWVIVN